MLTFVIAFLMGDLCLQLFPQLPENVIVFVFISVGVIIWLGLHKRWQYAYLPFAFVLGFVFATWYANTIMSWTLPANVEGKPMIITGYVASLPVQDRWQTNFLFAPDGQRTLFKLSWRDNAKPLTVGDKWQLLVKLKRIRGTQNPGAFDYEAWALQKGLRATGYVVATKQNKYMTHSYFHYPIDQLRQSLQKRIMAKLPNTTTAPWLMALILGERNGIAQQDWQVLRNTGTNHLMAIAGLHIGIMSGLAHSIFVFLWRRSARLVLLLPATQAGAYAALMTAVLYSALAGFSIPTQRACVMLSVFILTFLARRKISAWNAWAIALFIVLLLNPLSVLSESIWLSFGTIALIIYGMGGRLSPSGYWWKWGRVQWVIGFGLTPLTLTLFQECSLISFFANSVAIPWLGFFILPFCFLSAIFMFISPSIAGYLLLIADKSLSGLWALLVWFSQLPLSSWHHAMPTTGILITSVFAFIFMLVPAGTPGRWFGVLWLMPLILYKPITPAKGDFAMTLLDVGQGLSVVIQTNKHLLVYDAGPKFNTNFDMGESVVLPYLRVLGAKQLDMLVVSHGDNDHIGGVGAILSTLPVTTIRTSVPEKFSAYPRATKIALCLTGQAWRWDGVDFKFLYPTKDDLQLGNDSSCVLRIDNGYHRVLLTGDIERFAEAALLALQPEALKASILVAPHHGSKTSGVASFVKAVSPQYVLYATGYRNRYHFPHQSVVTAYANIMSVQLDTAKTGSMLFHIAKAKNLEQPDLYRSTKKRYWR